MKKILLSGFLVADIVAAGLDKIAEPGESVYVQRGIDIYTGGHPANIAIDLVKIGIKPKNIGITGTVGLDFLGKFIKNKLSEYKLRTFIKEINARTNRNVILVVKGEDRRFHIEVGSSLYLTPEIILNSYSAFNPDVFYISVGINGRADDELESILSKINKIKLIDLVPHKRKWNFLLESLKYTDILHCNLEEAKMISCKDSIPDILKFFIRYGVKLIFITLGNAGAIGANEEGYIKQRSFKVKPIDPTGAGDAFYAGIIYEFLTKNINIEGITLEDIQKVMLFGQATGASACTGPGATSGVNIDIIYKLIKDQGNKILATQTIYKL